LEVYFPSSKLLALSSINILVQNIHARLLGSFLDQCVAGKSHGFTNLVPTDAPVVGLRNLVPSLALSNVVKHALHHDSGTFERGLTVTDFRIRNNVFS
jgi:hypothetical protein